MVERYDLIVLGTGTAATVAAKRCREAGWSVAVIDERPFGGTCALRGCDPKKILVGAAESTDRARRLDGKGVRHGSLDIDWPALMSFKRSFTEPVPKAREAGFAEQGIRSEEHTSELQSLMRISYAVFCLKKKKHKTQ